MKSPQAPTSQDWQDKLYLHPLAGLLLLALAHVVARTLISAGMKWDESEQILWTQELLLGYGAQPPLYSWLQWMVVQLLGPTVLALAIVKHALIVLTYMLAWQAGRVLLPPKGAFWVAGSLVLMLPFGWHALRDQTHTVLVTAMSLGTWWMIFRQIEAPASRNFVWLGVFCGLGMLSKYSFALLLVVFAVAALTVPRVRSAMLAPGWWWAPVVGLLIFAPHGWWLVSHLPEATAQTINKMEIAVPRSQWKGLGSLANALVSTLGLWLLVVLACYRSALWSHDQRARPDASHWRHWAWPLLSRYLLLVFLALLAMVVVGHVSSFKQRWVLPLVLIAPMALYAWRPALLAPGMGRAYTPTVITIALVFLLLAILRPWYASWRKDPDELNHPIVTLAQQLTLAGYSGKGVVVGSDHMVTAMVHSRYPQTFAIACNPEFEPMPTCLAQARERAAQAHVGILVVARMDTAKPTWWPLVWQSLAQQPMQSLYIPFEKMSASVPAMHYEYAWIPAAAPQP